MLLDFNCLLDLLKKDVTTLRQANFITKLVVHYLLCSYWKVALEKMFPSKDLRSVTTPKANKVLFTL